MKTLVVAGAMIAAGSAAADLSDVRYTVGADFVQSWMDGKGNSAQLSGNTVGGAATSFKNVLPKSYQGGALYLGARFMENFGVELGGDMSARKKKDWTQAAITNGAAAVATGTSKIRRTGYHFDLVGFLPVADCMDLFASLGYGFVKAKLDITATGATVNNAAAVAAMNATKAKGKGVFRLGVGASWMFTDMFGLRAKLNWEDTSRLRINEPAVVGVSNATSSKAFKDTTSLSLGVFAKF